MAGRLGPGALAMCTLAGLLAWCAAAKLRAAEAEGLSGSSYHRQVTALFGKLGCNGGTCHGAVQGKNGFALSMFAADPEGDHVRLVREGGGRRLNFFEPRASLLLQKATAQLPHGGGKRLSAGSADYELLATWIARGAPADDAAAARLVSLAVLPVEQVVQPGRKYPLAVRATFADGQAADVTALCSFESLDPAVATVDSAGQVTALGVGDAGLLVRYRAQPAAARVLVPASGDTASAETLAKPHNFIDEEILATLKRLGLPPAELCDDATFLRRAYLDVLGQLPPPEKVRAFLADESPAKRTQLSDDLLTSPAHADLWTLRFLDLLKAADFGVYADALSQEHDAPRMQAWVRARLLENTPYDAFVARILLATSREGRSMDEYAAEVQALFEGYAPGRPDLPRYAQRKTLDLFWQRRGSDGVKGALQVAHAFLGLRLECAQCHRHPHDNWRQEDLLDFANFFMRVRPVGFQGDNEKKFPDAAAFFRQFNEQGKTLEAEVKQRKEGAGKQHEAAAKTAKSQVDKLGPEVARLEKAQADEGALAAKKDELAQAKETLAQAEAYRLETAALEKRAKLFPEIARRLLQAESRLLPTGPPAKVTSTLGVKESTTFRLLGETAPAIPPAEGDPREIVVAWLRRPENPFFARAIVNRVWAHYFGRGLVDPPDNLSAFNPASHPELLARLSREFVAHGYDLRWLHRTILASRTYQQASTPAPAAASDRTHLASFPLRRLPAEVFLDALNSATGTSEKLDMQYHHWPEGLNTVQAPFVPRNPFVAFVLETYGRPQRNSAVQCDCERDGSASIFQVLTLANHPRVWEKIKDPAGRVAAAARAATPDAQVAELYLAALSRLPTDEERATCQKFLAAAESPAAGLQHILWALVNTREFILQH